MFPLRAYDYLCRHRRLLWLALPLSALLLAGGMFRLHFSEDIGDFLPLSPSDREYMEVYSGISGADRIIVLFGNPGNPSLTVDAIEKFSEEIHTGENAEWFESFNARFDMETAGKVSDFIYANAPYFLTEADYRRMDSLLSEPAYIEKQLNRDRDVLAFPSSPLAGRAIASDPLSLFSPLMARLGGYGMDIDIETFDGYVFTPDMSRAVAVMTSPFGNSETRHNTRLLDIMEEAAEKTAEDFPEVEIRITGGPAIAVGNASRIRNDSITALSLSLVLIMLLLIFSSSSPRDILLTFLSVGWGWLFALGGMSLFCDSVSIIVLGISSVILGIAVNYPLHLIVHAGHTGDVRTAIRETARPLVIGNVTTVGAFLALVPLDSPALRDLGLFASLLLAGTILFVLVFLPHLAKPRPVKSEKRNLAGILAGFSPEKSRACVIAVLAVTPVLAFFSLRAEFDADITHINYITDAQREDMDYFLKLYGESGESGFTTLYVLSPGVDCEGAVAANAAQAAVADSLVRHGLARRHSGVAPFITDKAEQTKRLARWKRFAERHRGVIADEFGPAAAKIGFTPGVFAPFLSLISPDRQLEPQGMEYFAPLTSSIFSANIVSAADRHYVVDVLEVPDSHLAEVKAAFGHCFDIGSLNSSLTSNLSDDFNYIGWACSLIVFIFLWFSFGRISLALIAFLPMAVSWLWILGLMSVIGIKFNIVNVILATFIFGQGDDYTIFITEGCQWEYTRGRPILRSYKSGIVQSALIMLFGMGTLLAAGHPAMRSLAEVTVIGMFSVVLMAWMLPPLLLKWLTEKNGRPRRRPLSLSLLFARKDDLKALVLSRYLYMEKEVYLTAKRKLKNYKPSLPEDFISSGKTLTINEEGYGEKALMLALSHPEIQIVAEFADELHRDIAAKAAGGLVTNLECIRAGSR